MLNLRSRSVLPCSGVPLGAGWAEGARTPARLSFARITVVSGCACSPPTHHNLSYIIPVFLRSSFPRRSLSFNMLLLPVVLSLAWREQESTNDHEKDKEHAW